MYHDVRIILKLNIFHLFLLSAISFIGLNSRLCLDDYDASLSFIYFSIRLLVANVVLTVMAYALRLSLLIFLQFIIIIE